MSGVTAALLTGLADPAAALTTNTELNSAALLKIFLSYCQNNFLSPSHACLSTGTISEGAGSRY